MNIQTATEKLAIFLRANLVDPLNARTTAWIYSDSMRVDLDKSSYPKILLKKMEEPSLKEQLAIGCTSTENTDLVYVEVKALAGNHYTIGSTDYTAIEFVAELARQAEDLIKANHDYFVAQGFLDVLAVRDILEEDKDRNPVFRLGIQMHYISSVD